MRTMKALAAALAVLTPANAAAQANTTPASQASVVHELSRYANTPLVRLPDGRQMSIVCLGEGAPTVILSGGLGASPSSWHKVLKETASTNRVCAWSPAGFGGSDPDQRPQDSLAYVSDLEATLKAAHLDGPVVLVGHSFGAYPTLLFADRQPERVLAMVLVEPSAPDQRRRFAKVSPDLEIERQSEDAATMAAQRACIAVMPSFTGLDEAAVAKCLGQFSPTWPGDFAAVERQRRSNPLIAATRLSARENADNGTSSQQAVNPSRNYRDIPLIVLTRPKEKIPAEVPVALHPEVEASIDLWSAMHLELASLSTRGHQRIIPGADHLIPTKKPEAVVQAIRDVLRMVSE